MRDSDPRTGGRLNPLPAVREGCGLGKMRHGCLWRASTTLLKTGFGKVTKMRIIHTSRESQPVGGGNVRHGLGSVEHLLGWRWLGL